MSWRSEPEAQIEADRGDCDVHDGRVEDGHELAGQDQGQEDLHATRHAEIGLQGGRCRHLASHALESTGAADMKPETVRTRLRFGHPRVRRTRTRTGS